MIIGHAYLLLIPLLFLVLWVAALVYWIVAIVEVAKTPDWQFKAVGSEKVVWLLIVIIAGIIGALVWRFAKRSDVLAAAGRIPTPPPGWYPEPGMGSLRWWDGVRWSDARHFPPPPA
jgi:hypothetical protein